MENPQRSTLRKCRVRLVNDLAIDDLFDSIESRDIFTPIMLECIKAKESRPEKVRVFLDYLQRRGPDAFDKFLDCLRESGHSPIASYVIQEFQMQTGQGIPKLNISSGNQSSVAMTMQPVIPPNIFHTQETMATVAGQPGSVAVQEGQSSGEGQGSRSLQVSGDTDMGDDQEMEDDDMDLSGTLPSSIQESGESQSSLASSSSSGEVTSSGTCSTMSSGTSLDGMSSGVQARSETETSTPQTPTISLSIGYTGNLDEEYKMTSNPRGLLLIINNEKFMPPLNNRDGTDVDCDKLKTLFMSLGYGVDVRHNLEAMDMLGTLNQLSMHEQLHQVDSLVVAILTHGSEGGLYGVDGLCVDTADIYEPFTAERCAALHHKPKMFIINACRGDSEDSGSITTGERYQTCSVTYAMKGTCLPPVKKTDCRIPKMKDFLLAFSTIPGYVSWRHQNDGSWFIQELVKVFAEMSGRKDVLAMLVMVNRAVSRNVGEGVQIPNPSVFLTKDWYLNPMNG